MGEVDIKDEITCEQREPLRTTLLTSGLELIYDNKAMLIEKTKNVIVEMVHYSEEYPKTNFSDYLSEKLNCDYTHLANLFSDVSGTTIEHKL